MVRSAPLRTSASDAAKRRCRQAKSSCGVEGGGEITGRYRERRRNGRCRGPAGAAWARITRIGAPPCDPTQRRPRRAPCACHRRARARSAKETAPYDGEGRAAAAGVWRQRGMGGVRACGRAGVGACLARLRLSSASKSARASMSERIALRPHAARHDV
eukprot:33592-Prymnesium_polylepis.1